MLLCRANWLRQKRNWRTCRTIGVYMIGQRCTGCDTGNWQLHTNISGCPGYKIRLQHGRKQEGTSSSTSSKFVMTSKRRSSACRRSTTVALCVILNVGNMSTWHFLEIQRMMVAFDRPQLFKYTACMQLLRFVLRISLHDHPGAASASSSSSSAISSAPMFLDSANHARKQCCVSCSI